MQDLAKFCFELKINIKQQDLELCISRSIKDIKNIYLSLHMNINEMKLKGEKNG